MLQIIDRYLLRELALSVAATALVLLVITAGGTFADVLNKVALGRLPGSVMFPVLGLRVFDAFSVLLPLALFLGVMMALSRLYRDSEMHVLAAAGMGARGLLRPAAMLAIPLAVLAALVSLWLGPAAVREANAMVKDANRSVIAAGLEPGRFVELPGHAGVIFVKSMNSKGTRLGPVFIESERKSENGPARLDIVTAASGRLYHGSEASGRYLALENGHRFEGRLGQDDWKRMTFERNEVALTTPTGEATNSSEDHARSSLALARAGDVAARAELAWRISVPVSVLVLTLLAVALSRQTPREARYGRLLIAILVYLLYANVLALVRAGIVQGRVPPWLGLWWVHLLAGGIAAWIVWRQYRVGALPEKAAA